MDTATEGAREAMVSEALVEFKATLEAAVREVHVDVSAFKQRIEQRIEEVCVSNGPLAEAVARLQEENQQLRGKLESLSRLVEGLAGAKVGKTPAEVMGRSREESLENGHALIQSKTQEDKRDLFNSGRSEDCLSSQSTSTISEASASSGGSSHAAPLLPPWRAKRHAEINVSILHVLYSLQNLRSLNAHQMLEHFKVVYNTMTLQACKCNTVPIRYRACEIHKYLSRIRI